MGRTGRRSSPSRSHEIPARRGPCGLPVRSRSRHAQVRSDQRIGAQAKLVYSLLQLIITPAADLLWSVEMTGWHKCQQRFRRRPLHTVTTTVGALATVGALVSGGDASVGIAGKPAVGKAALQTDIANRLAKAGEQPQSVTCNEDLIGEVGRTARCEVVISPTNSFEPIITVTAVDGSTINYEMS